MKSKYRISIITFNILVIVSVFIEASTNSNRPKSRMDDEDSVRGGENSLHSSGDGPTDSPDVYPDMNPYTKSRSTATILVDVAFEHPYKPFMLPGSPMTPQLRSFQNDIIDNFEIGLKNVYANLAFRILSLRPGPLIPKITRSGPKSNLVPSVFVRMNITQFNSSIVNPLIIFQISQCGRVGVLGNWTVSEQIIFPQYVCTHKQVYCLPECRGGAYCDGVIDCPETELDEPKSCPKCLYLHLLLSTSSRIIDEDEELRLNCNISSKCQEMKQKIRWTFPAHLKRFEEDYRSISRIDSLPKNLIASGIYRCTVDGESSSINITVFKKPSVSLTKGDPGAETVIVSEVEGTEAEYWCNSTEGRASWLPVGSNGQGRVSNYDERSSRILFKEITKAMADTYHCHVQWGYSNNKIIKKTLTITVSCDPKDTFECKKISSRRSCIPINQKCDSIPQCDDGSDEAECNFCRETDLSIDVGRKVSRDVGDTVIMTCSAKNELCKPISWWSRGVQIGLAGNAFVFMDSLFFVQATTDQTGVYQCFDASNKSFVDVDVYINRAPTVSIWPQQSSLNLSYGQTSGIECILNHPTNFTYQRTEPRWVRADGRKMSTNVNVRSVMGSKTMLLFTKADESMAGKYYCKANWGTQNNKVEQVALTVNVNPLICTSSQKMCADKSMCLSKSLWCDGITQCYDGSDEKQCNTCTNGFVFVEPRDLKVLVGQTIDLLCYYDKDCYPVKWRIAGAKKPLTSVNRLKIHDNRLVITNAGLEATNTYECYTGMQRFHSNVTVIRQVELNLSAPFAIVDFGDDVNISCESNYGKPQWRRRDARALKSISSIKITHPTQNTADLLFRAPSYDSNGYYVCFVRLSPKEEEVASMLIYVHVKPLKCSPEQISCDGNTKCVSKTRVCDSVNDCADGTDEMTCSKCKGNPRVSPTKLTVTTNGYGVILCTLPNPECLPIEWKYGNLKSPQHKRFHPFQDSLYIINPRLGDDDEVMCTSGDKSTSALVIVEELVLSFEPSQPEDSPLIIRTGESKRIYCKSNLGSPKWVFLKDESFMLQFGVRYSKPEESVALLDLINIQKEASLTYVCEVDFSRENKRKKLSINVI